MRLGVIGYGGRIGGMVHKFRALAHDLRVVGIVDPNEGGVRQRLAASDRQDVVFYKDLDAMVRQGKPDALAVGTRCNLHTPYAIKAALYDLPLYLGKPVAINMRQARALERAFADSRCQVVVSFPLRVSPLCELAREYVRDGAVGEPVHVAATNYVPYGTVYWEAKYRDYAVTQGLFLQKATHDFDYLAYLMGSPIVRIAAMATWDKVFGGDKPSGLVCSECGERETCLESDLNRSRNATTGSHADHPCVYSVDCGNPDQGRNEDCSSALLQFASGAHGVYTQVFYARGEAGRRGAAVSGHLGTVEFDWIDNQLRRVRHHAPFTATERAGGELSHFGGDGELARNFVDVIAGRATSRTPISAGIDSVYACLAAKESSEKGRFAKVRRVGQA